MFVIGRMIFLLALIVVLGGGCKSEHPVMPRGPVSVSTVVVERKDIPADFEYVGIVAKFASCQRYRARVEGYLDEIGYREGQIIKQGDILLQDRSKAI